MLLFTSELSTGISSLSPFTTTHRPTSFVPVIRLTDYLADVGVTTVDVMMIGVEGLERDVLNGYDWNIRPEMIVLEFEDSKTLPLGYSWRELAQDLQGHGYEVLVSEWFPVKRYGGTHQWRRLGRYPTDLADVDGWGNLIAATNVDHLLPAARRAIARYRVRRQIERVTRPLRAATASG